MELDEDSHLCLRCNQTIIGLQNYVDHRRAGGCKSFGDFDLGDKPAAGEPYKQYDYDFFSSLELQLTSKSHETARKADESSEPDDSSEDSEADESEPEVPRDYTRGKWKPGARPPATFTAEPEDESAEEEPEVPPSHTRGKWVPGTKITKLEFKDADKEAPGAGQEHFWCSFCARNLATRAIYERHLRSNLHRKRTRQQDELEEAAEVLPLGTITPPAAPSESPGPSLEKPRKFRSRTRVTCKECELRLPAHLLGLHLVSHFHYRKMLRRPRGSFDSVLANFHQIVLHSPFQCAPCKFYFNGHDELLRHWNSPGHLARTAELETDPGRWVCAACKFDAADPTAMGAHLTSAEHQRVVALVNRSKPVVVRRVTLLSCAKCGADFRYNLQLLRHLRTCEKPETSEFRFAEGHVECDDCGKAFQSALSLQRHKIKSHRSRVFFCSECRETFASAAEAKTHRRTALHKSLATRRRMREDPELRRKLSKKCPVCKRELLDVMELRAHVLQEHPERQFSCGRCGAKFPLAQELSRHVRDRACHFPAAHPPQAEDLDEISPPTEAAGDEAAFGLLAGEELVVDVSFACKSCGFTSTSHAEFLFHEALHRVPPGQDPKAKLPCQVCRRSFSKQSLREHLRQHTNERIFECPVAGCPMSFTRKNNLKSHVEHVHRDQSRAPTNVCRVCGRSFASRFLLEQHQFVHRGRLETRTFPCQLPQCIYVGRSSTETRAHSLTHRAEKSFMCARPGCDYRGQTMEQLRSHSRKHQDRDVRFSCEHCDYRTPLSSHLKRHLRVHEKELGKVYKCPHCDYACNNSENLRKHVLKTNKHPGKFLYECEACDDDATRFRTNLMKQLQQHRSLAHP